MQEPIIFTKTIQTGSLPSILSGAAPFCQSRRVAERSHASLQELYNMDERITYLNQHNTNFRYGFFARTKAGGANDLESAVTSRHCVERCCMGFAPELLSDDYQPKYAY